MTSIRPSTSPAISHVEIRWLRRFIDRRYNDDIAEAMGDSVHEDIPEGAATPNIEIKLGSVHPDDNEPDEAQSGLVIHATTWVAQPTAIASAEFTLVFWVEDGHDLPDSDEFAEKYGFDYAIGTARAAIADMFTSVGLTPILLDFDTKHSLSRNAKDSEQENSEG